MRALLIEILYRVSMGIVNFAGRDRKTVWVDKREGKNELGESWTKFMRSEVKERNREEFLPTPLDLILMHPFLFYLIVAIFSSSVLSTQSPPPSPVSPPGPLSPVHPLHLFSLLTLLPKRDNGTPCWVTTCESYYVQAHVFSALFLQVDDAMLMFDKTTNRHRGNSYTHKPAPYVKMR